MNRVIIKTDASGCMSIITDIQGAIFVSWNPHIPQDEFYQLGSSVKRVSPDEIDAILHDKPVGSFGDRPGLENAVADALGVDRPHDMPGKPTLIVSNEPKP
jgi:hypothetical protein